MCTRMACRLFLAPYDLTPTYALVHNKFSVKYYLNLVLVDEEDRRYFKQQARFPAAHCCAKAAAGQAAGPDNGLWCLRCMHWGGLVDTFCMYACTEWSPKHFLPL